LCTKVGRSNPGLHRGSVALCLPVRVDAETSCTTTTCIEGKSAATVGAARLPRSLVAASTLDAVCEYGKHQRVEREQWGRVHPKLVTTIVARGARNCIPGRLHDLCNVTTLAGMPPREQEGHAEHHVPLIIWRSGKGSLEQRLIEIICWVVTTLHGCTPHRAGSLAQHCTHLVGQPFADGVHGRRRRAMVHNKHLEGHAQLCPMRHVDDLACECATHALVGWIVLIN